MSFATLGVKELFAAPVQNMVSSQSSRDTGCQEVKEKETPACKVPGTASPASRIEDGQRRHKYSLSDAIA